MLSDSGRLKKHIFRIALKDNVTKDFYFVLNSLAGIQGDFFPSSNFQPEILNSFILNPINGNNSACLHKKALFFNCCNLSLFQLTLKIMRKEI